MPTAQDTNALPPDILRRLQAAGLRRTLATRAVIGVFLVRPGQGLTHAQVLAALGSRGHAPNRVTLYRLLERLAAAGVLSRRTDDDRTWRFALLTDAPDARRDSGSARFECRACHRDRSLTGPGQAGADATRSLMRALARLGHQGEAVEWTVKGLCADCRQQEGGA